MNERQWEQVDENCPDLLQRPLLFLRVRDDFGRLFVELNVLGAADIMNGPWVADVSPGVFPSKYPSKGMTLYECLHSSAHNGTDCRYAASLCIGNNGNFCVSSSDLPEGPYAVDSDRKSSGKRNDHLQRRWVSLTSSTFCWGFHSTAVMTNVWKPRAVLLPAPEDGRKDLVSLAGLRVPPSGSWAVVRLDDVWLASAVLGRTAIRGPRGWTL